MNLSSVKSRTLKFVDFDAICASLEGTHPGLAEFLADQKSSCLEQCSDMGIYDVGTLGLALDSDSLVGYFDPENWDGEIDPKPEGFDEFVKWLGDRLIEW